MIHTNVFVSHDNGSIRTTRPSHPPLPPRRRTAIPQWFIEPKLITRPSGIANTSVNPNNISVVPKPLHKLIVTDQNILNLKTQK